MSKKCQISNKGPQRGNNVSKAHNKRKKVWEANLHTKRVFDSESGQWVRLKISSRILRTLDKKGLAATLRSYGLTLDDVKAR